MIYLSMDVHKDSVTIAVLPPLAKAPTRLEQLANDLPTRKKGIARVARDGEIHAWYDASGAGEMLHRAMAEWGDACDVIAPSLIPTRSGVHRTHDQRDAGASCRRARTDPWLDGVDAAALIASGIRRRRSAPSLHAGAGGIVRLAGPPYRAAYAVTDAALAPLMTFNLIESRYAIPRRVARLGAVTMRSM